MFYKFTSFLIDLKGITQVALKKLKNEEQIKEFEKEVSILRQLAHKNIVQYFGLFVDEKEEKYMVTEYMNKGSAQQHLQSQYGQSLGVLGLIVMARDAAAGMAYLHSQRIVHNDLGLFVL